MQLLVTLSTKQGAFTSSMFTKPRSQVSLKVSMPESVQQLRESKNACGLSLPVVKWLDAIRLEGSAVGPERFDELMLDFATAVGDANTYGIIWDREEECIELTMVFTNQPFSTAGLVRSLEGLQTLTKDHTLSPAWA